MARRRMIEVSIAYDEHFNVLSEFAQLLFLRILPHTDDLGRFEGNPKVIKARVMPLSDRKDDEIFSAILEILKVGLLKSYIGSDKLVIYYNPESFRRINAVLVKNNTSNKSEYPEPEQELTIEAYESHVRSRAGLTNKEYKVKSKEYKVKGKNMDYIQESFVRFWNKYPKRVGKKQALKEFEKINPDNELLDKILSAIDSQVAIGMLDKGQYTKHPATWLSHGCWEDELTRRENGRNNAKQSGASNEFLAKLCADRAAREQQGE